MHEIRQISRVWKAPLKQSTKNKGARTDYYWSPIKILIWRITAKNVQWRIWTKDIRKRIILGAGTNKNIEKGFIRRKHLQWIDK